MIPMVRRVFPTLIASDIVDVQPMSGPVGLAFALKYKYDTPCRCKSCRSRYRKLNARWTIELEQDLKALHGVDISTLLTTEIGKELVK
jgi:hypothetical protein